MRLTRKYEHRQSATRGGWYSEYSTFTFPALRSGEARPFQVTNESGVQCPVEWFATNQGVGAECAREHKIFESESDLRSSWT